MRSAIRPTKSAGFGDPALHGREQIVERLAWAEGGGGFGRVGLVVAAEIGGFALGGNQLFHDLRLGGGELGVNRAE